MPLTQVENELRLRARELIQRGHLPGTAPSKMWGGNGSGQCCSLCGKPIRPDEIEYEIEDGFQQNIRTYHFHFLCHAAWQFECARKRFLDQQQQF
jgi:hypothetical protein